MIKTHIAFGSVLVKKEKVPFKQALSNINDLHIWLGMSIDSVDTKKFIVRKVFSENFDLLIKIVSKTSIMWKCSFNHYVISFIFKIQSHKLAIEINCEQYSLQTFIQDWIYLFYRLKEYIETGEILLPGFDYTQTDKKNISITFNINTTSPIIFQHLTDTYYLRQIFSKYPECDLEEFHYSWGWIDEGPSNLISWKENTILIHDFIVDFNPIGYVKWQIDQINDTTSIVALTHKDINLEDEIDKERAYFSYKNGWMYLLAKIKDLAENKSFNVVFENELLD